MALAGAFVGSAAAGRTVAAAPSPTTTTVTSSRNPSVRSESLTLTATVRKSGTAVPATGLVTFAVDGATVMPGVPLLAGVATVTAASLSLGSHTVTVTYGGSGATYLGSSGSLTQTINKASAAVTVASTANPAVYGQELVITATVKPVRPASGNPGGTVDWLVGSTAASSTLANGKTELRLPLAAGSYPVTASYQGDANFDPAASGQFTETVFKAATTLTLTSSENPSPYNQPPRIAVTVTPVSPGAGEPSGTVTLELAGKTFDVSITEGKGTYALANYTPGSQTIDAEYLGDANFAGSDAETLVQSIGKGQLPALIVNSPLRPVVLGSPLSFVFTLTPPAGVGARAPTGSVTLSPFDGDAKATLTKSGAAAYETTAGTNPGGSYAVTYTGDANYNGGSYPPFKVDFKNGSTALSLSAAPAVVTNGKTLTLTATVTGVDVDLDRDAGSVTFTDRGKAIGKPVPVEGGKATVAVTASDPGNHTFRAAFTVAGNIDGSDDTLDVLVTTPKPAETTPRPAAKTPPKIVKKAPARTVKAPVKTTQAPVPTTRAPTQTTKAPTKTSPRTATKTVKAPAGPVGPKGKTAPTKQRRPRRTA